jgi:hypothetical protein
MGEVQKQCRHERKREKITRTGLLRVEKDKRVGRSMQSVMVCGCNATYMTVCAEYHGVGWMTIWIPAIATRNPPPAAAMRQCRITPSYLAERVCMPVTGECERMPPETLRMPPDTTHPRHTPAYRLDSAC